jgi:hypothetical protein
MYIILMHQDPRQGVYLEVDLSDLALELIEPACVGRDLTDRTTNQMTSTLTPPYRVNRSCTRSSILLGTRICWLERENHCY